MRKKLKNLGKLAKIYKGYRTGSAICSYMPLRIWLEPTDKCNLSCPLCINSSIAEGTKGFINWDLYKKILDELENEICDINLFHRGEPLLHPKIAEMVSYANEKGLNTRIHTNATMLNESLSNALLQNGLNYISFSFDGFDKETYEKNRVNANFEKTLGNILGFLQAKKRLNADTFTVLQVIDTGIIKYSRGKPRSILLRKELDALPSPQQAAGYSRAVINNKEAKKSFLNQFNGLPLNKLSIRTPHNWAGGISASGAINAKKPITCTFPWYGLTIFHDGRVVPCCQDYMGKIYLGDINKESIHSIWNGKTMQDIRSNFSKKNYSQYEPCSKCDRIWRRSAFGIPLEYIGTFLREAKIRK